MQIKVNDNVVLELTPLCYQIIQNDIPYDIFEEDMIRRLQYILTHKRERCQERLIQEWTPKLAEGNVVIPNDKDALCEIIFAQPDYKCRKTREDEVIAKRAAEQATREAEAKVIELASVQAAIKQAAEDRAAEEAAELERQAVATAALKAAVEAAVKAALEGQV